MNAYKLFNSLCTPAQLYLGLSAIAVISSCIQNSTDIPLHGSPQPDSRVDGTTCELLRNPRIGTVEQHIYERST